MWIVRLALRRPYTFIFMSVLIVITGILAIIRTPKDIFPDIDIPVISVIWTCNGQSTQDARFGRDGAPITSVNQTNSNH